MKPLFLLSGVCLVFLVILIGIGVGIGFFLEWMFAIDRSFGVLIGAAYTIFGINLFSRALDDMRAFAEQQAQNQQEPPAEEEAEEAEEEGLAEAFPGGVYTVIPPHPFRKRNRKRKR